MSQEHKCFCWNCPNYSKCLDGLKKVGVTEREIELIEKAAKMDQPIGFMMVAFYYLLRGATAYLESQNRRRKKWALKTRT